MTHLLNIIFPYLGIRLLGYSIEFSCLYIPPGHYFTSTLLLWRTDKYVFFVNVEGRSTFNFTYPFSRAKSKGMNILKNIKEKNLMTKAKSLVENLAQVG